MAEEHIGILTNCEEKIISKGKRKGQPFLSVTLTPDKWTYSLFEEQHIFLAKTSNRLKIIWEEDGEFRNVVDVQAVEGQQAEVLVGSNELRERRITRTAIAKSIIERGWKEETDEEAVREASLWFNWVWEIQEKRTIERSSEDIQQSEDTLSAWVMQEMMAKRGWNETVCRTTLVEIAKENKWTVKGATAEAILSNWDSGILATVFTRVKQYPIVGV